MPPPSSLHGFWWEIYCHSNCILSLGKVLLLPDCFQDCFFHEISEIWLVSWCGFLRVYPIWDLLSFLKLWVYVFCQIWKFSGIISLSTFQFALFPFSFRDSKNTNDRSFVVISQVPKALFTFVLFCFLWCLDSVLSITLSPCSLILSSVIPILLLIPSTEFFILVSDSSVLKSPFFFYLFYIYIFKLYFFPFVSSITEVFLRWLL